MKNLLLIFLVIVAWVLSMLNASGLGIVYDTPGKTNILILIWYLFYLKKRILYRLIQRYSALVFFIVLSFIILPLLTAGSIDGISYLMMIPLVYCFSELKVTEKSIQLSGYIVAVLGLFILYVYTRSSILSGWNDNHISMIGLFSYIYFSISLYGNMSGRKLTIGLAVSLLYVMMLSQTNSRSAIIFIILALLIPYSRSFFRNLFLKKNFVFFAINVPLIISLMFILFPNLAIFDFFNEWSLNNYGKDAFNGRDEIWIESYERLLDTYFLGEGEFLINHHNSAVAVLSVFGLIGYICWYKLFAKTIRPMCNYVNDDLLFGFISSFLLIFWQQSFELGFVNSSPNMIPYMILGLGLARTRDLRQRFPINIC